MIQHLNKILDTIHTFSNIEICTIDEDLTVNNISYHDHCPKQIMDAYIQFFSDIFLKYNLNEPHIYYLITDFNISFYLININLLDKKYILGPFLMENWKDKDLKELILGFWGNKELRAHTKYYRSLPVMSSIQRSKLESLLTDITNLDIHITNLSECTFKEEPPIIDPISAYHTGIENDIELRYKIENHVLDCIRFGTPKLLQGLGEYPLYSIETKNRADSLRAVKIFPCPGMSYAEKPQKKQVCLY